MESFLEQAEDTSDANNHGQLLIKYKFRQFLLASYGLIWGICAGAVYGFSSIIFKQRQNGMSTGFQMTIDEESWAASIVSLAMLVATLPAGWVLDKYGRRCIAALGELISLTGWLAIYFANSYQILMVGRFFTGLYVGLNLPVLITYIAETTSPKYRPTSMSILVVGSSTGILITQLLGNYLQWNLVALVYIVCPFYNLGVIYYVRESYIWYIYKNEIRKAKDAFLWFRGSNVASRQEFEKASADVTQEQSYSLFSIFHLLRKKNFAIPFGVSNLTFFVSYFSGLPPLVFFTSTILNTITRNEEYQYYTNTVLNICRVLGVIVSSIVVKRISVKSLLLASTYAMGAMILNLALFVYLSTIYPEKTPLVIIALISVILIGFLVSLGLGPLEVVVCGELYPANVRGIGSSATLTCSFIYLFISLKITPGMLENLGVSISFVIFGLITLVGITIVYLFLPNTKDKTLKEIENMYKRKE